MSLAIQPYVFQTSVCLKSQRCDIMLLLQDGTNACDVDHNITDKAQPNRLRSLDTFRGYVSTILFISPSPHAPSSHDNSFQSSQRHDEDGQS